MIGSLSLESMIWMRWPASCRSADSRARARSGPTITRSASPGSTTCDLPSDSKSAVRAVTTAASWVTTRKSDVRSKHFRVKFNDPTSARLSSATMYFA